MKPPKETTDSPVQAAWWSSAGILYFFAAGSPPHAIKIGVAALTNGCTMRQAVTRRFKQIQSSNHETVELLGIIAFTEGQYPTRLAEVRERELHLQFAHLQRFKAGTRGSEWFMPSEELLSHITEISTPLETLDLPRFIGSPVNCNDRNI
ncbi:MAG TPA: GIY-YIG nuclease family protein [Candidatus Angelobacter sp.]|nr:GIY-YIG nuclease family protein [Candidatus Angelobacter sp.]